jgi:hypothetical protein
MPPLPRVRPIAPLIAIGGAVGVPLVTGIDTDHPSANIPLVAVGGITGFLGGTLIDRHRRVRALRNWLIESERLQQERWTGTIASWTAYIDQIPASLPTEHQQLRTETIALVNRNIDRLRGIGADGYQNWPDLAERGIVEANIEFLRRVTRP